MNHSPAKHVVLIVFDYMGYGDIEPFGQSEIRTPNIRALAKTGVRYTDFYSAAPICVPSRAAMLTGRYPRHLGIENNIYHGEPGLSVADKSLARYFKDGGLSTALYGKWHLGYEVADGPNAHGFDDFVGFHEWNIDYYSHNSREGAPALYHNTALIQREGYTTDLFTDSAVEFIGQKGQAPYFLYVGYNAALPPYSPPGREDDHATHDTWKNGNRADYVAAVEHLDLSVGRIMDALDEQGLRDDTVVLLTYDHGGAELATKGPFFHGFGTLWEGGIRVPMILHWPNGPAAPGSIVSEPAIGMDLVPTLLGAAGLAADQTIDGRDLLAPDADAGERTLHWRSDLPDLHANWRARAQRAVRRGQWKYLWDGGFEFLHDLSNDPGERENLGHENPELLAELKALAESDW
ncbi:MAG: sulfatase-like hydrolase/transferase [Rhodospirillaceae bacterium]|nr:sulfatase-like hydrolase/transferase [Rhodospirillaceae bacterium]MBT5898748.1 sulfatase-like hydrolase/transferase [Rhodospirillaceae bacterium]MBT6426564.1 sulfatase-like hydrolase/transferase [Rhodospirillaceae bacterium]MBT7760142.1 sulfatase-like hydrolase/transferase [Rhodospirillaceae bacterium]